MQKLMIRILLLAILVGGAWAGFRAYQTWPQKAQQVPVAKVRRGDVLIRSYTRGELRAVRSVTLTAPNLFSTVQVTRLAPLGSLAHEKDLIVEFDDSDRRAQLEETQLEVEQTNEQIKKAEADLAIRNNQDLVDLLRAKFAVRRSALEVKRNALLAEIDAKKNLLALEENKRRLQQLEVDIKARQDQAQASINLMKENRGPQLGRYGSRAPTDCAGEDSFTHDGIQSRFAKTAPSTSSSLACSYPISGKAIRSSPVCQLLTFWISLNSTKSSPELVNWIVQNLHEGQEVSHPIGCCAG
jgi:hypothetical protein